MIVTLILLLNLKNPIGFQFFEFAEYLESLFDKEVDIITSEGLKSIRNADVKRKIKKEIVYV